MSDVSQYTNLVTSEHSERPNFIEALETILQPFVDMQNQYASFSSLFDIDVAVGDQLDKIGVWVGVTRFNSVGVLNDDSYRILLKGVIASNHWDGTVPGAYSIWAIVFALEGFQLLIQDNQDMTMLIVLLTTFVSPTALSLLTSGQIVVRPAGVRIAGYFEPGLEGAPIFGFDVENATVSGFDVGYWAIQIA